MSVGRRVGTTGLLALALLVAGAGPAGADPAKPTNFESRVLRLTSATSAVQVTVVGGDGFLSLEATKGHTVLVGGYESDATRPAPNVAKYGLSDPWLRILADGTVEENINSTATYLSANRFAKNITIPATAGADRPPSWKVVGHDGTYIWHDHRIHWMAPGQPPPKVQGTDRVQLADEPMGAGPCPRWWMASPCR